jgi:hypothetical protein
MFEVTPVDGNPTTDRIEALRDLFPEGFSEVKLNLTNTDRS